MDRLETMTTAHAAERRGQGTRHRTGGMGTVEQEVSTKVPPVGPTGHGRTGRREQARGDALGMRIESQETFRASLGRGRRLTLAAPRTRYRQGPGAGQCSGRAQTTQGRGTGLGRGSCHRSEAVQGSPGARQPSPGPRHATHAHSELHHLEVLLARAAFRTGPVHRNIGPGGTRGDAMLRITRGFVVDPAADQAHPGMGLAHGYHARGVTTMINILSCRGVTAGPGFPGGRHRVTASLLPPISRSTDRPQALGRDTT